MFADAAVLEARDIVVQFDGLTAIDSLSLTLQRDTVCGLIGPNGAGKTTFVNVLTGFQKPSHGKLLLGGEEVTHLSPTARARAGIVRTFQNVRLFSSFTVFENLVTYAVGTEAHSSDAAARAAEVLAFMRLGGTADTLASTLPYGMERRVGIARALAASPTFLLLDEPAAGLNDAECDELMAVIRAIPPRFGCGVLLIEHNMRVVMSSCDRICVIDFGRKIAEGTPTEVRGDEVVLDAYLGRETVH
jgi:branched-chain amino acid transport system ATP-binding protein